MTRPSRKKLGKRFHPERFFRVIRRKTFLTANCRRERIQRSLHSPTKKGEKKKCMRLGESPSKKPSQKIGHRRKAFFRKVEKKKNLLGTKKGRKGRPRFLILSKKKSGQKQKHPRLNPAKTEIEKRRHRLRRRSGKKTLFRPHGGESR